MGIDTSMNYALHFLLGYFHYGLSYSLDGLPFWTAHLTFITPQQIHIESKITVPSSMRVNIWYARLSTTLSATHTGQQFIQTFETLDPNGNQLHVSYHVVSLSHTRAPAGCNQYEIAFFKITQRSKVWIETSFFNGIQTTEEAIVESFKERRKPHHVIQNAFSWLTKLLNRIAARELC